jgi:sugar phosphate isomerase/epimerase
VDEALALIAQAGFRQIETCGPQGYFDRWEYRSVAFMRAKLERAGLRVRTVHVPVKGWALGDLDDDVRTRAVDAASASLTHAALVGAELVVLHPNAWRGSTDRAEYETVQQRSNEDIAMLAESAARVGIKIAVENMFGQGIPRPGSTMTELRATIEGLGEHVGLCLDTGHCLIDGLSAAAEALVAGDKLFSLHLADNDGSGDQHLVPGQGAIDWAEFRSALATLGYRGPRMFEISSSLTSSLTELLAQQWQVAMCWESEGH